MTETVEKCKAKLVRFLGAKSARSVPAMSVREFLGNGSEVDLSLSFGFSCRYWELLRQWFKQKVCSFFFFLGKVLVLSSKISHPLLPLRQITKVEFDTQARVLLGKSGSE